jgi:hypothetical protein
MEFSKREGKVRKLVGNKPEELYNELGMWHARKM